MSDHDYFMARLDQVPRQLEDVRLHPADVWVEEARNHGDVEFSFLRRHLVGTFSGDWNGCSIFCHGPGFHSGSILITTFIYKTNFNFDSANRPLTTSSSL